VIIDNCIFVTMPMLTLAGWHG